MFDCATIIATTSNAIAIPTNPSLSYPIIHFTSYFQIKRIIHSMRLKV
jgi:hypothetical protein